MLTEVWKPNPPTFPLPNTRTCKHKLDSSWEHPKIKIKEILTCCILEVLLFFFFLFMYVHVWGVCMCVQTVCPPMPVLTETSPAIFFHHFPRSFLDMESPRESGASLPFRFDRLGSELRDTPVLTPCFSWTTEDCLHTWPYKRAGEANSCLHTWTASSSLLPASRVLGDL